MYANVPHMHADTPTRTGVTFPPHMEITAGQSISRGPLFIIRKSYLEQINWLWPQIQVSRDPMHLKSVSLNVLDH